jgi:tripartite ATP-independent transporter DctM subunit
MDVGSIGLIVLVVFFIILFTGLNVCFVLFGVALLFNLIIFGPQSLYMCFSAFSGAIRQETWIAIPLFVLMASFLEASGIGGDLYDTMHKWMSGLKGGLAMGTAIICALIDAMSGLGATATVTMGMLALPEMLKRGYNKDMAVGVIPAGGALGPIIPPSVIMVLLGGLWGLSVGKLFMAGFIPGILITVGYCTYIGVRCTIQPHMGPACPPEERGTWRERLISLYKVILPIVIILLMMVSIYSGAATPTETAGIGATATFLVILFRKKLTWVTLTTALSITLRVTSMVVWLLIGGFAFGSFINSLGISELLTNFLIGLAVSKIVILWAMMIIVLMMGCFIDGGSIIMICSPVYWPVCQKMGWDPIWFGLVMTIAVVIGYITPPFGMNLFYMKGLVPKDITIRDIYRSIIPYVLIMIFGLLISIHFPIVAMWLPNMMK